MINFKKMAIEDRAWIDERLREANLRGCEYSFGNMYIWRKVSKVKVADVDGFLCIAGYDELNELVYNYPVGTGDEREIIETLCMDAEERGQRFKMRAILEEQKERLEEMFPDRFTITTSEGDWDYIYSVEKLTALSGKKYHGKRNHIARFKDGDDWSYEPITMDNINECVKMNEIWCKEYGCGKSKSAELEQCAVRQAFENFGNLGLEGGLLRKGGEVVAFAIGEPINSDTYGVHIEKAFPQIQGAYPMINQQLVEHNMQNFTYVNREEDLGDEGLRKAKQSYGPEMMVKRYTAIWE